MSEYRLLDLLFQQQSKPVERLSILPHPYGMLKSEGRGSVMSNGIDWGNWIAPRIVASAVEAFKAPANALMDGDYDVRDASNFALNMLGGGAVGSTTKPMSGNVLGSGPIFKSKESLLGLIPNDAIKKIEAWNSSGGRTHYSDINALVRGVPLSEQQRNSLVNLFDPRLASSYEKRIERNTAAGNHAAAERARMDYDAQLMANKIFNEIYSSNSLNTYGASHPNSTSLSGAVDKLKAYNESLKAKNEEALRLDRLNTFKVIK